jgi:hypothetical protein
MRTIAISSTLSLISLLTLGCSSREFSKSANNKIFLHADNFQGPKWEISIEYASVTPDGLVNYDKFIALNISGTNAQVLAGYLYFQAANTVVVNIIYKIGNKIEDSRYINGTYQYDGR